MLLKRDYLPALSREHGLEEQFVQGRKVSEWQMHCPVSSIKEGTHERPILPLSHRSAASAAR